MTAFPPRSAAIDPSRTEDSTATAVAIITPRGGSVGIPRRNARLQLGAPLLAYAIDAARRSAAVDAVFVSTDDAELAELARRFGAEVIERPAALAGPEVTLDAVILDAVFQLDASGRYFDDVVTIQPTSPLVRPATIDRVVDQRRERGDDTVLTVVNEPHGAWGEGAAGARVPPYRARRNRQELPPHFRETGGVVVCRREVLAGGSRFGERVSAVEMEKAEALDIDDPLDGQRVEKSLRRRRIGFRVIGNRETGLGHAYRALTLADRLIDHDVRFVVREEHALAAELIASRFHRVELVPAGNELAALRSAELDLVVSDVLDTEKSEMEALRELGAALVNFEDLGSGAALADHVVNALYDAPASALSLNTHHGAAYCVLRDEFYSAAPIEVRAEVRELLLLFGATDPGDLTARCLGWLEALPGDWRVTAVLGLGYRDRERLEALAARCRRPVEIVSDTEIVSRCMARADLAITSAGRTVFELASLGVPMLVIPQDERECRHTFANHSRGVIILPRASELEELEFLGAAHDLLSREELRRQLHRSLLAADVRSGVDRALDVLAQAVGAQENSSRYP